MIAALFMRSLGGILVLSGAVLTTYSGLSMAMGKIQADPAAARSEPVASQPVKLASRRASGQPSVQRRKLRALPAGAVLTAQMAERQQRFILAQTTGDGPLDTATDWLQRAGEDFSDVMRKLSIDRDRPSRRPPVDSGTISRDRLNGSSRVPERTARPELPAGTRPTPRPDTGDDQPFFTWDWWKRSGEETESVMRKLSRRPPKQLNSDRPLEPPVARPGADSAEQERLARERAVEEENRRFEEERRQRAERGKQDTEEEARRLAQQHQEEERRRAEAAEADRTRAAVAQEEARKVAEMRRLAEERQRAFEAKQREEDDAERKRLADAEEARKVTEMRRLAEERQRAFEEQQRAESEKRRLAALEERRREEERAKREEEERSRAEAERRRLADADEKRKAKEQRLAEERRKVEEQQRIAEDKRLEEQRLTALRDAEAAKKAAEQAERDKVAEVRRLAMQQAREQAQAAAAAAKQVDDTVGRARDAYERALAERRDLDDALRTARRTASRAKTAAERSAVSAFVAEEERRLKAQRMKVTELRKDRDAMMEARRKAQAAARRADQAARKAESASKTFETARSQRLRRRAEREFSFNVEEAKKAAASAIEAARAKIGARAEERARIAQGLPRPPEGSAAGGAAAKRAGETMKAPDAADRNRRPLRGEQVEIRRGRRFASGVTCREAAGRKVALPGWYVVQRGDTLWKIAARHYVDGSGYRTVYRANLRRINDPDQIYPCQQVRLPLPEPAG